MSEAPKNMNEHIAAFVEAQKAFTTPEKNAVNPQFKSGAGAGKYADLHSVRAACVPHLNANGFMVSQPSGRDEVGEYIETRFDHISGNGFSTRVHLKINKPDMQGLGSAKTYARRYGLLELACLAPEDEDDDGGAAAKNPDTKRKEDTKGTGLTTKGAMQDAWVSGVLDSLEANATPRQKAEAFAKQIIADFDKPKTSETVMGVWDKREALIGRLQADHNDLWQDVLDAYGLAMRKFGPDDEFGLPPAADG